MSGAVRTTSLRFETNADETRRKIEQLGTDGDRALSRIGTASLAAQPALQNLGAATDGVTRSLGSLGVGLGGAERVFAAAATGASGLAAGFAALGAAAAGAGVFIARTGDQATQTLARLNAATGSVDAATRAYQNLFALSQQTGVAVAESAGAFARFAIAAGEVGATNRQVLALVRTIQQAGIVSGAATSETQAAVTQLGQALASGVLQGDELRSLLENMPNLAQALARELGVGVGELRKMGSEGQLTADRVLPALIRAGQSINEQFEKMPVTMSRAFDILGSSMTNFGAQLDKALGLSQAVAAAVIKAAGAVNGLQAALAPTAQQAADQAVQAAQERLNRAQTLRPDGRGQDPLPQFGQRRGQDAVNDVRGEIEAAQRELREALAWRQSIRQQAREDEAAEAEAAREKARANELEHQKKIVQTLQEGADGRLKVEREYQDQLAKIRKAEETGAIPTAEADRLRAAYAQKRLDELAKIEAQAKTTNDELSRFYDHIDYKSGLFSLGASDDKAIAAATAALSKGEAENKRKEDEQKRALEKQEADSKRTTDSIVDYTAERFANLFSETGRGWAGLWDSLRTTAISTIARIAAEALIRPIVVPIVASLTGGGSAGTGVSSLLGGAGSTGSSFLSGASQLYSLSGIGDQLGLSGAGSYLGSLYDSAAGSLASSGIFGSSATNSALASLGQGVYGPATASQVGSAGIGNALGGIGLGYTAGSFVGGLINKNHSTGANIGSGVGSAIGAIWGPVGSVVGGVLGGAIGSLFGPGKKHHGWSWGIQGNGADGFGFNDRVFVDPIARQQFEQEQQQIAQVNAWLRENSLSVSGFAEVGGNNNNPNQVGSFNAGISAFRFSAANDNTLNGVLSWRAFDGIQALQDFVGFVRGVYEPLLKANEQVSAFDAQIKAITDQFQPAIERAKELGLAEQDLVAVRDEQIAKATAERDRQAQSITDTLAARLLAANGDTLGAALANFDIQAAAQEKQLKDQIEALGLSGTQYAADRIVEIEQALSKERLKIEEDYAAQSRATARGLLTQLAFGSGSALAPEQQYFAALSLLNSAKADLAAGGSLSDFTGVAQQVLPVARDFLGTSERYASLVADVAGTVAARGGDAAGLATLLQAQADGTDALASVFVRYGEDSLQVQSATLSELRRLASTLEALIARQTAA